MQSLRVVQCKMRAIYNAINSIKAHQKILFQSITNQYSHRPMTNKLTVSIFLGLIMVTASATGTSKQQVLSDPSESPEENEFICGSTSRACENNWYRGCLCTTADRCEVTWVNECESCQDSPIYSVNAGETCPGYEVEEPECFVTPKGMSNRLQ